MSNIFVQKWKYPFQSYKSALWSRVMWFANYRNSRNTFYNKNAEFSWRSTTSTIRCHRWHLHSWSALNRLYRRIQRRRSTHWRFGEDNACCVRAPPSSWWTSDVRRSPRDERVGCCATTGAVDRRWHRWRETIIQEVWSRGGHQNAEEFDKLLSDRRTTAPSAAGSNCKTHIIRLMAPGPLMISRKPGPCNRRVHPATSPHPSMRFIFCRWYI